MNSNQIPLKARNHRGGKERAEKQTHKYSLMNLWQDNSTHLQWNTPESASAWISSWALTGYFPWTFTDLCRGHKVPPALLCTCAQVLPVAVHPPWLISCCKSPPSHPVRHGDKQNPASPWALAGLAQPQDCQQGSSVISEPCARRSASHKRTSWPAQKGCTASPLPGIQHRRSSTKSREHFECFCHLAVPLMAHTASRLLCLHSHSTAQVHFSPFISHEDTQPTTKWGVGAAQEQFCPFLEKQNPPRTLFLSESCNN